MADLVRYRSDDDGIMHPKSFSVKRSSQPMEEQRSNQLLDQVCYAIRPKHCSYRTERAYVGWVNRYQFLPRHASLG